ncbi:hypothetical protein ACIPZF_00905 [Pseudomonas sp. NPDC089752]|uniref:hypothetical protein n=1 Tax=Pseudomonas sp. NPDC089752 TaxID=3364472 RepID=UPI00381DE914
MDPFNTSGLALQKNLLALRKERDRLKAAGMLEEALQLARQIAQIEAVVERLPLGVKPPTLQ